MMYFHPLPSHRIQHKFVPIYVVSKKYAWKSQRTWRYEHLEGFFFMAAATHAALLPTIPLPTNQWAAEQCGLEKPSQGASALRTMMFLFLLWLCKTRGQWIHTDGIMKSLNNCPRSGKPRTSPHSRRTLTKRHENPWPLFLAISISVAYSAPWNLYFFRSFACWNLASSKAVLLHLINFIAM